MPSENIKTVRKSKRFSQQELAAKRDIEHPMMLAANREIKSGDDVIWVASTYFSRWENRRIFPQYYFFSCRPSLKASPTLPDTL